MSTQLQYVPFSGMVVYQTQDSSGNNEYVFDSTVKLGSGNGTTITSDGVVANYVYATDICGGNLSSNIIKATNFSGSDISMTISGNTYVVSGLNLKLRGSGDAIYGYTYLILHNPNSVAGQTETEPEAGS